MLVAETACHSIIDNSSGIVSHQHVTATTYRLLFVSERVHAVEEFCGVWSANFDATERRYVYYADVISYRGHFFGNLISDSRGTIFIARITGRALPHARGHEYSAVVGVPAVHRRQSFRFERPSRQHTERYRLERWALRSNGCSGQIVAAVPLNDAERV